MNQFNAGGKFPANSLNRNRKLGTCMWGMPDKGLEGVRKAAELGFSGIAMDISLFDMPDDGARKEKMAAFLVAGKETGIVYPSLSVEVLNEAGLTSPEGTEKADFVMDVCRRGIQIAYELGTEVLQLPSFNDGAIRSEEELIRTCEMIRRLCLDAAEKNVLIASENDLNLEDSLRMIETVGQDNFRILFDTQNYFLNGVENTPELFRAIAPYVTQIHVKDGTGGVVSNALIGEGESGFDKTAEAVNEAYKGEWLLIETYYDRPPFCEDQVNIYDCIRRDMETCRRVFHIEQEGYHVSSSI